MKPDQMRSVLNMRNGVMMVVMFVFLGGGLYVKSAGLLSPGPLSAVSKSEEPIEGYFSHAEFEKDCSHCHAPVHCLTDTRCQECHMDVAHQRTTAEGLHGRLPGTSECQNCHVEHQGRDAMITSMAFANLDHQALSGFSLALHQTDYAGAHMDCQSCHAQEQFSIGALDCITCHVENDHDGMAEHIETYSAKCVECHDGADRMQNFEHADHYMLEGAHVDAECAACHVEQVYSGLTRFCADCHDAEPEHIELMGLECDRCHTATAWTPAPLTRHQFAIDHGELAAEDCDACHVNTYTEYTCYGCHDHTVDSIRQSHLPLGIVEYEQCAACHPTGLSGEGEQYWKQYNESVSLSSLENVIAQGAQAKP